MTPCTAGNYCPSGSISQIACTLGYYCPAGSSTRPTCTAGTYCPHKSTTNLCTAGYSYPSIKLIKPPFHYGNYYYIC